MFESLADSVFEGLEVQNNGLADILERVTALENAAPAVAAVAASAPTQQNPRTPSTRIRCQRCHALGHDTNECRTKDPAMTKKRVMKNTRAKKQAQQAATLPYPLAHFPHQLPSYPPPTTDLHAGYAALLADATEMRRCAAQSRRDKGRSRRATTVTTST